MDDVLLLGTHDGLWRHERDRAPVQVAQPPFDVMGLFASDDGLLASGHPTPGTDRPPDLGLLRSVDGGQTWSDVALTGQVDFHALTASAETVIGVAAHDGSMLVSTDAGATWTMPGVAPVSAVTVDPADPSRVLAVIAGQLQRSTDGGASFDPEPGSPELQHLAWTTDAVFGVDRSGVVQRSSDGGATWYPRTSLNAPAEAMTAEGERVAVLAGGVVYESPDAGATFVQRLPPVP